MRAGIRAKLKDSILELEDCYEPTVPTKDTPKPYGIILQGSDDDNGEVVGFKRTIEIWLYEKRTTFKNLDSLSQKVIDALDMQVINDTTTHEVFTCIFDGAIGQDVIDEDWNAIARGLRFTVIALHEDDEVNTDTWLEALSTYTKGITNNMIYLNSWKKNFVVPSILWRVKSTSMERENYSVVKENKTLICHVASKSKNEINKILDDIENSLINDLKIPLDLADRRYLTIESIVEDREADMFSKGQLIVNLFRRKMIERNEGPIMQNIYGRGKLE